MTDNPIETAVDDLKEHAQDACKSAAEYSDCALERGRNFVQTNPAQVALGAFALGFMIAVLLPKPERPQRNRYLEDPLDELKELLRSTSRRIGQTTQETRDSTSSAIGCVLKKLKNSLSFLRP